jgi:hypothetical protein
MFEHPIAVSVSINQSGGSSNSKTAGGGGGVVVGSTTITKGAIVTQTPTRDATVIEDSA